MWKIVVGWEKMVSIGNDYDLIDSYLNRRQYTDKLLDQLLHESKSFSFKSTASNESEQHEETLEQPGTDIIFRNMIESKENVSIHSKELEKPLEDLFMVKSVQNLFNIRAGSFSEMIVNVRDSSFFLMIVNYIYNF